MEGESGFLAALVEHRWFGHKLRPYELQEAVASGSAVLRHGTRQGLEHRAPLERLPALEQEVEPLQLRHVLLNF